MRETYASIFSAKHGLRNSLWALSCVLLMGIPGMMYAESASGPFTRVDIYMGLPTFMIDGEPHMSTSFETYVPNEKHFRQMSEAGATVFGFPTNCGEEPYWHSTPTWVGDGVWDFSEFEESVSKILAANPNALLMPRINVSEPEWWRAGHPDELMVFDDGTTALRNPYRLWPACKSRTVASFASPMWREAMAQSLRRMIEHIQAAPYAKHIFAYQLFGQATEEWYNYTTGGEQLSDYSPHARRAFQQWLRNKYGDDAALRKAWRDPSVTFDSVAIPSREERRKGSREVTFRDPEREMNVIDYYTFHNELMADTIDYFCGVAKTASHGAKAVGAFYAYMFEFCGGQESGHLAVQKLLQSKNVDFIVVTASYGSRQLGTGGSILRSPHTSIRLHGKLWYEDNDNVSFLFPEVSRRMGDAEWERSKVVLAATDTSEESKWIYERGAGFVLGNGIYQSLFDLHGGYFDHPDLLKSISGIFRVFENSKNYDRTSCSEILVVADERSTFYCTVGSQLLKYNLYDPPYQLIKCGAPYDAVYVGDLALCDTSRYKLILVLNAFCLDAEQRRLIETKVKLPGKTVFWSYAPGLFDEGRKMPEGMSDITGIRLVMGPESTASRSRFIAPRITLVPGVGGFAGRLLAAGVNTIGPTEPSQELIYADEPNATVLGTDAATERPVLVRKNFNGWTSIYAETASLSPLFYRELAREAGVHIYNDRDDTMYVSASYLTLNADGPGERTLGFPQAVNVVDPKDDKMLAQEVKTFSLPLRDKETRLLRIERKP